MSLESDLISPVASNPTRTEDAVLLGLCACLLGGIFLDGYAHVYVLDTDNEDFFTPWHAIFYFAFLVTAAWIGVIAYRRRRPGPLLHWVPPSHRLSVGGLALFALGGVGDGIWHTIFGVEVGIDALLSPTHIFLLTGLLLIVWAPVRAATDRAEPSPWLPIGAVALTTSALTFFIEYLWVLPWTGYPRSTFNPVTEEGANNVQLFFGSTAAVILVLLVPLLLLARRWPLPFGAATIVWTVAATLESAAFSQQGRPVLLAFAGGMAFDLTQRITRHRTWGLTLSAGVGPAVIFAGFLIGARADGPLGWPPEIWSGLVLYAAAIGVGLALLQQSGSATPVVTSEAVSSAGGPNPGTRP